MQYIPSQIAADGIDQLSGIVTDTGEALDSGQFKIFADNDRFQPDVFSKLAGGKSLSKIEKDTERDNYLSSQEALEYGLIDGIFEKR